MESPGTSRERSKAAVAPRSMLIASAGAAVGDGLGVGDAVGLGVGDAVGLGVGDAVGLGVEDAVGAGVGDAAGTGADGVGAGGGVGLGVPSGPGGLEGVGVGRADAEADGNGPVTGSEDGELGGVGGGDEGAGGWRTESGDGPKNDGARSWIVDRRPPRNGILVIGGSSGRTTDALTPRMESMSAYTLSAVTTSATVRIPARPIARKSHARTSSPQARCLRSGTFGAGSNSNTSLGRYRLMTATMARGQLVRNGPVGGFAPPPVLAEVGGRD
jgi:hypothetical protein